MARAWNTFVYTTTLAAESAPARRDRHQPGTVPLPTPLPSMLVVRIPNPRTMNDPKVKIENEVAALAVVRASASKAQLPVADVYAWSGEGWGWMIMEHLSGSYHFKQCYTSSKLLFCFQAPPCIVSGMTCL